MNFGELLEIRQVTFIEHQNRTEAVIIIGEKGNWDNFFNAFSYSKYKSNNKTKVKKISNFENFITDSKSKFINTEFLDKAVDHFISKFDFDYLINKKNETLLKIENLAANEFNTQIEDLGERISAFTLLIDDSNIASFIYNGNTHRFSKISLDTIIDNVTVVYELDTKEYFNFAKGIFAKVKVHLAT